MQNQDETFRLIFNNVKVLYFNFISSSLTSVPYKKLRLKQIKNIKNRPVH